MAHPSRCVFLDEAEAATLADDGALSVVRFLSRAQERAFAKPDGAVIVDGEFGTGVNDGIFLYRHRQLQPIEYELPGYLTEWQIPANGSELTFRPGMLVWVREPFRYVNDEPGAIYLADAPETFLQFLWTRAIKMPKRVCRMFARVESVRISSSQFWPKWEVTLSKVAVDWSADDAPDWTPESEPMTADDWKRVDKALAMHPDA